MEKSFIVTVMAQGEQHEESSKTYSLACYLAKRFFRKPEKRKSRSDSLVIMSVTKRNTEGSPRKNPWWHDNFQILWPQPFTALIYIVIL